MHSPCVARFQDTAEIFSQSDRMGAINWRGDENSFHFVTGEPANHRNIELPPRNQEGTW